LPDALVPVISAPPVPAAPTAATSGKIKAATGYVIDIYAAFPPPPPPPAAVFDAVARHPLPPPPPPPMQIISTNVAPGTSLIAREVSQKIILLLGSLLS
jgi:hypothetical protein